MIIGTCGHIDHGKTSLVRALTGVDTDRLKEEKARGISIELGYAYTPLPDGEVLGFVDVPGHERFVPNMLAGVGPVPAVLLVVASVLLPLGVLDHIAHTVGIVYASDLLLSLAVVFLVVLVFHQSVQLAETKDRQTALTQEIALMRVEPPAFAKAGHLQLEADPLRLPSSDVFDRPDRPRP